VGFYVESLNPLLGSCIIIFLPQRRGDAGKPPRLCVSAVKMN